MKKLHLALLTISLLLVTSCIEQQISEDEKKLFLQRNDFTPYGFQFDGSVTESFLKENFLGTPSYEYELEAESREEYLYVYNLFSFELTEKSARESFLGETLGAPLAGLIDNTQQFEKIEGFSYGDQSELNLITSEGSPIGNVFICRMGKTVFSVYLYGLYFDEPIHFREFITPLLERFRDRQKDLESRNII